MSIYGKEDDAKIQKDLDPYTGLIKTIDRLFYRKVLSSRISLIKW